MRRVFVPAVQAMRSIGSLNLVRDLEAERLFS